MTPADERFATALRLAQAGQPAPAAVLLTTLLREQPARLPVRHALVRVLLLGGDATRALVAAEWPPLIAQRDLFAAVLGDFAAAGAQQERAALLTAALHLQPHDYAIAIALAAAEHSLYRPGAALHWSEHALALRPHERVPREIHATALIDRGDVEAGLAAYRNLLERADAATAARHLVLMHYDPAQHNAGLYAAHHAFVQRHVPRFGPPFNAPPREPGRRLRVGWLSPRIAAGPVATFLPGLLAHFDRERHRHLLVALQPARDAAAHALAALADEAIDASAFDDRQLLQRLRALQLDVLIDLAGHSTANRLPVIAQRVAPLQVCWLDWFDTTALATMDAWFSDRWLTPEDSDQRYSERLVRLPSGRFCYTPPDVAPEPSPANSGAPVFASFNRLAKLNERVLDAWAEILKRVPQARLELRARHLGEAHTRAHIAARFAARGIDPARVGLGGQLSYGALLGAYRDVDVALDPFPFSGCTTTCDALWMGCPVVTLPGSTFVSRQSASLLWRLGREEWVAQSLDDYVGKAVALAMDADALRAARGALREAVRQRLCDADAQARDFAAAFADLLAR